jgi:hypothetical protein
LKKLFKKKTKNRTFPQLRVTNLNLIIGLAWYWPILSLSLGEMVSGQDMVAYGSPGFMNDRFGNANGAAVRTSSSSYWQAPTNVYFSGADFTITGWIYLAATAATELGNCLSSIQ